MKKPSLLLILILLSACAPKVAPDPVIFRFAGDVMFDRGIKRTLGKGVKPFRNILQLSTNAHVMMVNLETTVATNGIKVPKAFNFMSLPDTLTELTNAGIDLVSIANNHTMDYGESAIQQTRHNLEQYGILFTGAGMDYQEASRGVIIETNGIKIGFLAFGDIYPLNLYAKSNRPGIAGVDPRKATKVVKEFKKKVDILVVSLHWGWEYEDDPKAYQPGIAHAYIDSGADLIIGHHPHVLQGVEKYKQGVIFYSMGNFIFDQKKELKTRYTLIGEMLLTKTIDKNGLTNIHRQFSFYPFIKDYVDYMPREMNSSERKAWMNHFSSISKKLGPVEFLPRENSDTTQYLITWPTNTNQYQHCPVRFLRVI